MRTLAATRFIATCLVVIVGCADEPVPPLQAPLAPSAPDATELARLRLDDAAGTYAAARAIVASGSVVPRRAASKRLVALANEVFTPAWRATTRAMYDRAKMAPDAIDAHVDALRNVLLGNALAAMEVVCGPDAVAYAFWMAENDAAPRILRRQALDVLLRCADRSDGAARTRAAAAWERVKALPPEAPGSGSVADASRVVAGMAAGFRRCYNKGLAEDRDMTGTVRVIAKIDAQGLVVWTSPSGKGLSAKVVACVVARVAEARFAPPEGGGATIVIPVTFVTKD